MVNGRSFILGLTLLLSSKFQGRLCQVSNNRSFRWQIHIRIISTEQNSPVVSPDKQWQSSRLHPTRLPSCLRGPAANRIICVISVYYSGSWQINSVPVFYFFIFFAVARHRVFNHRRSVTSWYCYWPKVTHSPRISKSVRAGTWERGECGRDAGAEVTVLLTHTWVWVVRWALPCSTWPTPSCLCWWSRGQDHMASRYRPLLVHSGSARAQCRGSRTQGHTCRQKTCKQH